MQFTSHTIRHDKQSNTPRQVKTEIEVHERTSQKNKQQANQNKTPPPNPNISKLDIHNNHNIFVT